MELGKVRLPKACFYLFGLIMYLSVMLFAQGSVRKGIGTWLTGVHWGVMWENMWVWEGLGGSGINTLGGSGGSKGTVRSFIAWLS